MTNVAENHWIRRTRVLTQVLIISGTLNIGLISTFVYFVLKDKQESLVLEIKPPKDVVAPTRTNEELLQAYSFLPFQELLLRLENKDFIEEGLAKRDLALACLNAFHHFNLEKALGGLILQKRAIRMHNMDGQEAIEVAVFPGLADFQFQAIIQFARTEKWPLTSQGLFYELKATAPAHDLSLLEAFCLTPEFHAVHTLFSKTGLALSREKVVELLLEGEWKTLSQFAVEQRQALDLTPECRRAFLLTYLKDQSKLAAKLLVQTDSDFVAKRLDDNQILTVLDILHGQTAEFEGLAKELLVSPRIDAVRKKAAEALYGLVHETPLEPYDYATAITRFAPSSAIIETTKVAIKESIAQVQIKKKMHTVEVGENLWKIARKYQVTIDSIIQANHLETEKLRPGKQLEIPEKKT